MNVESKEALEQSAVFFDCDPEDNRYAGAGKMILAEFDYIRRRRAKEVTPSESTGDLPDNLVGLALSGGGIRSATFSLGIMQALARHRWLERVDYLSTVSGGGYIGSSLTWLTHQLGFGVGPDNFPFGTQRPFRRGAGEGVLDGAAKEKTQVLRWLRQHGKYLAPGDGITVASLIAVILRCILLSVLVYFPFFVLLVALVAWWKVFEPLGASALGSFGQINGLIAAAIALAATLIVCAICYSMATWLSRMKFATASRKARSYAFRRFAEKWSGRLLMVVVGLLVSGSLPFAVKWLDEAALDAGLLSSLLGALSSGELFRRTNGGKSSSWRPPTALVAGLGFVLMAYGVLLLAYITASWLLAPPAAEGFFESQWFKTGVLAAMVVMVFVVGRFTNLNYVSIHRYYRDRLMEAFMPNIPFRNPPEPAATMADLAALHTMAPTDGPYHLVNTNVVLVGSEKPKYRGRGGDNFILSPGFCGSNATGWGRTDRFMGGNMTLPTAMAISGAAANPHTGVGGQGITRGRFASFLLAFLNVRLGYWAPNPHPEHGLTAVEGGKPNFLYPGLWELLFIKNLNEKSPILELTDGGHFENLALYELVRRKCSVIICCDGAADPGYAFSDLTNAIERVRVDFGARINIRSEDLDPLASGMKKNSHDTVDYAKCGSIEADIEYADDRPDRPSRGKLIYIKATFPENMPADLRGYKIAHPTFPNESTADQFFDEQQFEAYRELGFHLGEAAIEGRTLPA